MVGENQNMHSDNERKTNFFIPFVIVLLVAVALAGYLGYEKIVLKNKENNSNNNEVTNQESNKVENKEINNSSNETTNTPVENNESTTECQTLPTPKCVGTYYGEQSDFKYTYTLNNDGTFTLDVGGVGTKGTFAINGNTISLTSQKHTTGPVELDPQYMTEDLVIANDCSYIVYDVGTNFRLNKIS